MSIGERLRKAREFAGLRQKEAARLLKINPSVLSRYENDVHHPDLETLAAMADLYKVSADYLLGLIDVPEDNINPERILILVANAEGREELRPVSPELEKSIKEAIKTAIHKKRRAIAEGKWPPVQKDKDESGNG